MRGLPPVPLEGWDDMSLDEQADAVNQLVTGQGLAAVRASASTWCASSDEGLQAVGLGVLGLLGVEDQGSRIALTALDHLAESRDTDVRWAFATALGLNSTDPTTTSSLLRLARDPDDDVRLAAVAGLSVPADDEPGGDGPVVTALLSAMRDVNPDIRDWATFALGVQREVDLPEVREALMSRLADEEADTAGEAAVGLARRGDARVLPRLRSELADPEVGNLWVEAAVELPDPSLLPLLHRLKSVGWQDDEPRPWVLDDAIELSEQAQRAES